MMDIHNYGLYLFKLQMFNFTESEAVNAQLKHCHGSQMWQILALMPTISRCVYIQTPTPTVANCSSDRLSSLSPHLEQSAIQP